jgi:hypothetical protein
MIITECTSCGESIWYPYEAGEEPCGPDVYDRQPCEHCGAINFIQRVSIGGETLSEADAIKRGMVKRP